MPKFRTKAQNSRMHGLGGKLGLPHEDLRDFAFEYSNGRTDHTSELYIKEAANLINYLDSLANPKDANQLSQRTINYHKQKAGIGTIETQAQLKLINDLWFKYPHRTASGLESICLRTIKIEKPRTTKEGSKIVEAIKSMNAREGKKNSSLIPQPSSLKKEAA